VNKFFSLNGKVALITGSYGYLGEIFVYSLASAGATVYANGRNQEKINNLIRKYPDLDIRGAKFDVNNLEEINQFVMNSSIKSLDILVNNAYSGKGGIISSSNNEDYFNSYQITITATHNLTNIFLPFLKKAYKSNGDASVINVASMYGITVPDLSIYESEEETNPPFYGTSKAAMIHWTKYASVEFGAYGIRFNSLSPGAFPNLEVQKNKKFIQKLSKKVPLDRIGQLDDLIGPILFLASKASNYITGENIVIDGGWTV